MMTLRTKPRCLLLAAALAFATIAPAQETAPVPQTLEEALHQLSDAAGVAFVGEVVAIRHRSGENGSSGVVEIDFRIDQAVRGCSADAIYTLREWAGLWSGGDQRYSIGQRLLMLLHTPGATGVSSPVGGMAGAIRIRGSATELAAENTAANGILSTASALTASASSTPAETPATPMIADLRWVGTRVQRTINYEPVPAPSKIPAAAKISSSAQADVSEASTAAQQAPVSVVVDMITAWARTSHEAK
jgi:hypothetical protein